MSTKSRLWSIIVAVGACAFGAGAAQASTIDWNTWNPATKQGSISPEGITVGFSIVGSGGTWWVAPTWPLYTPTTTWADGTVVANAPVPANNLMGLNGGNTLVNTLTFSSPVVNPVMAIWSLGSSSLEATFEFNATPTFVAGGPSTEYGGTAITVSGNTVSGSEGNGTVMFLGTFSSISWTNPIYEHWYGFNVGIAGVAGPTDVPEPAPLGLLLFGLACLGVSQLKRLAGAKR